MKTMHRVLGQSVAAAIAAYTIAVGFEAILIQALQPTGFEVAWVSDLALAVAFGSTVYLWRGLLSTRRELAELERSELVLQAQLSVAADIQRRLLPVLPGEGAGFECAAAMQSAGKIGGDFYDFVEAAPGQWVVLIADVSGKGIPAAMALGSLRSTFRALARQRMAPSQLVAQLSAAFLEEWRGTPYVTAIVATFDMRAGTVTYSNAGHPRGVLLQDSRSRWLDSGGPPAGLLAGAQFDQEVLRVNSGDRCVLVTDGVTEALDDTAGFADDLADVGQSRRAADICASVMTRAMTGHGPIGASDWDDDRTVVVVTMNDVR